MLPAARRLARSLATAASSSSSSPVLFDPAAAPGVATITINRPSSLNALSTSVARAVVAAARAADADAGIRAVVVTGAGDRAFAAGADVKELAGYDHERARSTRLLSEWDALATIRLPLVAAVDGLALGGGCEVALMCDVIVASDAAVFAQPELALGVTPGMGATARLTRALGRYRAMDVLLTGRKLTAREAEAAGLVARVVPAGGALAAALDVATALASGPPDATAAIKRCVNAALDSSLSSAIQTEHAEFWGCFGSGEQREGMGAFLEKRGAVWAHAKK